MIIKDNVASNVFLFITCNCICYQKLIVLVIQHMLYINDMSVVLNFNFFNHFCSVLLRQFISESSLIKAVIALKTIYLIKNNNRLK